MFIVSCNCKYINLIKITKYCAITCHKHILVCSVCVALNTGFRAPTIIVCLSCCVILLTQLYCSLCWQLVPKTPKCSFVIWSLGRASTSFRVSNACCFWMETALVEGYCTLWKAKGSNVLNRHQILAILAAIFPDFSVHLRYCNARFGVAKIVLSALKQYYCEILF